VPAWIRRYSDSVILSPDFESGRRISEILRFAQDDKLRRAQDDRRKNSCRWLLVLMILPLLFACTASTDWNNPCDPEASNYSVTECAKKQQSAGSQCEWCGRAVNDLNGGPLPGAKITLSSSDTRVSGREDVIVDTDGSGCIDFSFDTSSISYSVTVTMTGYQDYETGTQTWGCHPGEKEIRLSPTSPGAPSAPTGLAATPVSTTQINLSWQDNSNNEDKFGILVSEGSAGSWSEVDEVTTDSVNYFHTGLNCGTTYWYRVYAGAGSEISDYSNEVSATTWNCTIGVPAAPSNLILGVISESEISLYWVDNSDNEDGFLVERKSEGWGTYEEIKVTGPDIMYFPDNGLSAVAIYYYRVRAYNEDGTSGYSEEVSATTSGGSEKIPPEFVLKWGSNGSGDGQFNEPGGLAVDSEGNVYVGDSQNSRVQKFSAGGTFLLKWGSSGTGDGQFGLSGGVAIDGASNIYVADQNNHRIQKFSSDGVFITKWGSSGTGDGQFGYFYSIASDNSGNIYVADRGNYRIQKFDSNGNFLTKWGSQGSADGQFDFPSAIAVSSDNYVYVTDYGNCRVQRFTSTGGFQGKWGSCGSGDGQFSDSINGVAVDSERSVYVVDSGNSRVQKFTSDGGLLNLWGSSGTGDGQFNSPVGIATDRFGNIYVSEFGNDRIQKFRDYSMTMASIPAGCFYMGDSFNEGSVASNGGGNELPVHYACVSDFQIGIHEVSNAQYRACVTSGACTAPGNSSSFSRASYYGNATYDNYPVIYVNWGQAEAYCQWEGGRLPTEAEWEYAARGGLSRKRFPWGDTISCVNANYYADTQYSYDTQGYTDYCSLEEDTSPVGGSPVNGYGLHDIAGNVWEWVNDWYSATYYASSPVNDPTGPGSGSLRVLRGGSWNSGALHLRTSMRYIYFSQPPSQYEMIGFRCAR